MKHKYLFFGLFLAISNFQSFAQTGCPPGVEDVFDFEIGDELYFLDIEYDAFSSPPTVLIDSSYSSLMISNKSISGDSIMYEFTGENPMPENLYFDLPFYFEDSLILVANDSNNIVNKCHDDFVELSYFSAVDDTVYTRVIQDSLNGISIKQIGGFFDLSNRNLFKIEGTDTLVFNDEFVEQVYGPGLGLLKFEYAYFESRMEFQLLYKISNGDTTGVIQNINSIPDESDFALFPNPVQDELFINLENSRFSKTRILIYDSFGRVCKNEEIDSKEMSMDLSDLSPGVYYYSISIQNRINKGKIIKL